MRNIFFVIDGMDGCGKSTQIEMLATKLKTKSLEFVQTRDPGGTALSEKIREILLDQKNNISNMAELFLFTASRIQMLEEIILPAMRANKIVISDRFISSTIAYQAFGGGLDYDTVSKIVAISISNCKPTFTFILDLELEESAKRMNRSLDRMEQKNIQYKQRVLDGFRQIGKSDNHLLIDARQSPEQIHDIIWGKINDLIF